MYLDYSTTCPLPTPSALHPLITTHNPLPTIQVLNDAFWAMLFQLKIYGSKKHTPDKVYEWLAQVSYR